METSGSSRNKSYKNKSGVDRDVSVAMVKVKFDEKAGTSETERQQSRLGEFEEWLAQQTVSKTTADVLGQSTPVSKSFEDSHSSEQALDVSRVEVAEELQKQQSERLEKLWEHQNEQQRKIFYQLDQSMTRQKRNANLRDQHARQLEDLRLYYEGEMSVLKEQLADMKSAILHHNKHEQSMKTEIQKEFESLSQANMELSSKYDALESAKRLIESQLKQCEGQKQELESQCQQLVATNQIIDARTSDIKRTKEETDAKLKEIEEELKMVEARCEVLTKEKAILKNSKDELERNYSGMQEENRKLIDKCHRWKEENKIFRDRNKTQENLLEKTNKNVRELERVVETLKKELEDKKVKFEVDKSLFNATQQRVDRLVVQNRDKDLMIKELESKVVNLEATVEDVTANTAKAGLNEIKESIKRDKELLKRVLREYDSLNIRHEKAKDHVQRLEEKLAESHDEGEHLRKELSEVNITRKNLENSLREVLMNKNSCRKMVERSTRRTWEQSENFNFFPGEPIGRDDDVGNYPEKRKITGNMESTRRHSMQPEKDELVDLSPVQSRVAENPVYAEAVRDSVKVHPHFDVTEDGTLKCSFCNQVSPSAIKKNKNRPVYCKKSTSKKQSGFVTSHFKRYNRRDEENNGLKDRESFSNLKGKARDGSKAEVDAFSRRVAIVSAEKKYLELSEQRRRLEAALLRVSTSRMTKENREDKKFLENKLDEILKEIGKTRLELRMQDAD